MLTRDIFFLATISFLCCIFPETYLNAQHTSIFRSDKSEKYRLQEVSKNSRSNYFLEENLAKNSKLIKKEDIEDQCLSLRISYVCTPENMYEIFKNARTEGLFYSYDDNLQQISTKYKKQIGGDELNFFNFFIFKTHHSISIQLSSCKENLSTNMIYLTKLIDEYSSFIPNCQTSGNKPNK